VARKPSDTVQLKLRFPEALRRRLEREARRHGQSLNREIVSILEERFRESDAADRHAAAFADALRDEFMRLYREDKTRGQAAGGPPLPTATPSLKTEEEEFWINIDPKPRLPREKEPHFSSSSWRATPSPKIEGVGEKK
jgi:Arc-like DNA binding dprotein